MTTYYKAVRPDGTDFATGTTRPVVGEWMPRIDGDLELCRRGYHVSDAPAETLIGGSWPCRLFEVEIEGGVPAEHIDGHKRVVPTYLAIRELPAWQALGPNGEAVVALVDRARAVTEEDALRFDTTWAAAQAVAAAAARYAARDAARDAAQAAAWHAAWDAALALVVRDLITPEQFDVLYGPWACAIEGGVAP